MVIGPDGTEDPCGGVVEAGLPQASNKPIAKIRSKGKHALALCGIYMLSHDLLVS